MSKKITLLSLLFSCSALASAPETTPDNIYSYSTTSTNVPNIVLLDVTKNDVTDFDGLTLKIVDTSQDKSPSGMYSVATVNDHGVYREFIQLLKPGAEAFSSPLFYQLCNADNECSAKTRAQITYLPQPFNAVMDNILVSGSEAVEFSPLDNDLINGKDNEEARKLTVSMTKNPQFGNISLSDNKFTYTPAQNKGNYTDVMSYSVCDELTDECSDALILLKVQKEKFEAVDDNYELTIDDYASGIAQLYVLDNDAGLNDDHKAVTFNKLPEYGTVFYNTAAKSVIYVPSNDLMPVDDSFDYTVCNDDANCDSANVTMHVNY